MIFNVLHCVLTNYCVKEQRDKSEKDYKHHFYAKNDGNYLMAIYEGKDAKGKIKRDFEIVNNYESAEFFKESVKETLSAQGIDEIEGLVASAKEKGKLKLPLKYTLKIGKMVLFYEKQVDEIWELSNNERSKRLYKITQFESDGRLQFRYHQVAKQDKDLNKASKVNFSEPEEKLRISISAFNAIVEGIDFKITPLGKIQKL